MSRNVPPEEAPSQPFPIDRDDDPELQRIAEGLKNEPSLLRVYEKVALPLFRHLREGHIAIESAEWGEQTEAFKAMLLEHMRRVEVLVDRTARQVTADIRRLEEQVVARLDRLSMT